jgi:hypothetical protein
MGYLYNAGLESGVHDFKDSSKVSDVHATLPPPGYIKDPWRQGGVIHLYGGGLPEVVVIGSSHAVMYGAVIDDICRQLHLSVAFLSISAASLFPETSDPYFSSATDAREFYEARTRWLEKWHPRLLFIIDRWDVRFKTPLGFEGELHSLLTEVSPLAQSVLFVAQPPALRNDDQLNLRELVTWQMKYQGRLPVFFPDAGEPLRKRAVGIAQADTASFPNLRIVRADLPFYNQDGSVRYSSGREFFYLDETHLTESGAEVVRGIFQRAILNAVQDPPSAGKTSGAEK